MRLQGKVAVVTGAGTGIGRAAALRFAREGARLVLVGRRAALLEETRTLVEQQGGAAAVVAADLTAEDGAWQAVSAAVERFGGLDIVVNNAGVLRRGEVLHETAPDQWEQDMAANVTGVFYLCKHALPALRARGGGAIVNVASQLAHVGAPGYATYSATKGAVVAFTRALAIDYAGDGIRCNCVSPGLTDTPMAYTNRPGFDPAVAAMQIPLGRMGQPEDIANAVLFLASDEAAWITGQTLVVDGGYTAR